MIERVAFIGVGRMGSRMASRLLDAGYVVAAFDPNPAAMDRIVARGAEPASCPAAATSGAGAVLCSLPTPDALVEALSGEDGALRAAKRGVLVIDFSTGDPGVTRQLAETARTSGLRFLDAPVSRGVAAAEAGTLAVLVGGAAEDLEEAQPILSVLASDVVHVGDTGAGQVAKLCNNILAAITATALGEVLVAGVRAGVELESLTTAISAGSGGSFVLDSYLPRGLFTEGRPTGFALALMRKDLALFMQAGSQLGLPLPISAIVQQQYVAAQALGLDEADWTSVAEIYERCAGVRLEHASHSRGEAV